MSTALHCAVDESELGRKGQGDGHLVLAAYVFRPEALAGFNEEWEAKLESYGLPAFHMTDCMCLTPNDENEFTGWSKAKRERAARDFVRIIRSAALFGFCLSDNKRDYWGQPGALLRRWDEAVGGLYPCGLWIAFREICRLKDRYPDLRGRDLRYYVESGYETRKSGEEETPTERALAILKRDDDVRAEYRCSDAQLKPKGEMRSTEAADILAWLWMVKGKRVIDNKIMPARELALELTASAARVRHFHLAVEAKRLRRRAVEIAKSGLGRYLVKRSL